MVFAERRARQRMRLAQRRDRLGHAPLVVIQECQVVHRRDEIGVAVAEQCALHRERLAVIRLGARVLALVVQHLPDVHQRRRDVLVLRAVQRSRHVERLLVESACGRVIAGFVEQQCDVVQRLGEIRMDSRMNGTAHVERRLHDRDGLLVVAEVITVEPEVFEASLRRPRARRCRRSPPAHRERFVDERCRSPNTSLVQRQHVCRDTASVFDDIIRVRCASSFGGGSRARRASVARRRRSPPSSVSTSPRWFMAVGDLEVRGGRAA